MPSRFVPALAHASREVTRIRTEISHADAIALSPSSVVRERAVAHRAAAYVWLAAALESVVRAALQEAAREISSLSIPSKQLRVSLFSLICDAEFASIADRSRQATWDAKTKLLSRVLEDAPAALSEEILPLDGRTIRAEHFDTIWTVLGLAGHSLPSPRHRFALKDLADGRNEVAHGHQDPVSFGRTKATVDMLRLIDRVDDVMTHFLVQLDDYLATKSFAR